MVPGVGFEPTRPAYLAGALAAYKSAAFTIKLPGRRSVAGCLFERLGGSEYACNKHSTRRSVKDELDPLVTNKTSYLLPECLLPLGRNILSLILNR